jgi:hypothetical protein
MDPRLLPRYRGFPDSPKGWAEPDERGRTPTMRLRDYVVLSFIILMCLPINLHLAVVWWAAHRHLVIQNSSRHELVWDRELEPRPRDHDAE